MINNEEIRPTSNLIVSNCTAYDYLNNSNPNLEKLTTQYYETFSITGRFTGYFSNITIGDFYDDLSTKYCGSTAILGGLNSTARQQDSEKSSSGSSNSSGGGSSGNSSSSGGSSGGSSSSGSSEGQSSQTINENDSKQNSENQEDVITNPEDLTAGNSSIVGDRGTENFGIAVFNKDKLCGELTATESICHLLITNNLDSCILSIPNPIPEQETEKIELQIFPTKKSKINLDIQEDSPHISIDLSLNADILTLDEDVNYENEEVISKIVNATNEYLTKEINDYLKKVSSEYETDIDNFCTKATTHFLTISDWENFNWNEKFKNSKFDVNIDINVLSTMLVTET